MAGRPPRRWERVVLPAPAHLASPRPASPRPPCAWFQVTVLMMVVAQDSVSLSRNSSDKTWDGSRTTLAGLIILMVTNFGLVRARACVHGAMGACGGRTYWRVCAWRAGAGAGLPLGRGQGVFLASVFVVG